MRIQEILVSVFSQLISFSPVWMLYLAGFVFALRRRRQYPQPCRFVIIALGILFLSDLAAMGAQGFALFTGYGRSMQGYLLNIAGGARSILHGAGLGLLLAAVFAGRARPAGRSFGLTDSAEVSLHE